MPGSPTDGAGTAPVAVSAEDYLWFVDLALSGCRASSRSSATTWPTGGHRSAAAIGLRDPGPLPGRRGVLGRSDGGRAAGARDRAAEFRCQRRRGRAACGAPEQARRRLREDIVGLDPAAAPSRCRDPDEPVPYARTKGAVLLHILEELFQHLGHMEITRDRDRLRRPVRRCARLSTPCGRVDRRASWVRGCHLGGRARRSQAPRGNGRRSRSRLRLDVGIDRGLRCRGARRTSWLLS